MKLTILLSDLQLPLHHRKAIASICNFLREQREYIDEVFQVGDFYDFEAISHWSKGTSLEDGNRFQKELDGAAVVVNQIHEAWPWPKQRIMGNHDDRLEKYLDGTARGLSGLRVLDFDTLTNAVDTGWITVPQPYKLAHRTTAVHGLGVRSKSGFTPHFHLDKLPGNVVHGHTHRAGLVYRTVGEETRWAMELGCLMDRKRAQYLPCGAADWQLAFGALWIDGKHVQPELIHVDSDGSFMFLGERWKP